MELHELSTAHCECLDCTRNFSDTSSIAIAMQTTLSGLRAPSHGLGVQRCRPRQTMRFAVHANTRWSLAPRKQKSKFFEGASEEVQLIGESGAHRLRSDPGNSGQKVGW